MKKCMKTSCYIVLTILLPVILMAGCGASSKEEEKEAPLVNEQIDLRFFHTSPTAKSYHLLFKGGEEKGLTYSGHTDYYGFDQEDITIEYYENGNIAGPPLFIYENMVLEKRGRYSLFLMEDDPNIKDHLVIIPHARKPPSGNSLIRLVHSLKGVGGDLNRH